MSTAAPLCCMYFSGLDRRWVTRRDAPHLYDLLDRYPSVSVRTIPTNELSSTIYTGAYPRQHGKWQVTLRRDTDDGLANRILDWIPANVSTTWQCLRHVWDKTYDIPGVPRRRRRKLESHRFKYSRRQQNPEEMLRPGGIPTIFSVLEGRSVFRFSKTFERLAHDAETQPEPGPLLTLLEAYGFDLFQHWHLDQTDIMREKVTFVDRCVRTLHERCDKQGIRFLLLSDHGQEVVKDYVNLQRALRQSGVPRSEYLYYLEPAIARFWFHTDRARRQICDLLRSVKSTRLLTYRELHEYNICFDDDSYGEVFLYTDHGSIFYPNDFAQPFANLFMALTEPTMRRRLFSGRLHGYHGQLPDHPAEEGYLVLADDDFWPHSEQIELIDIAPTLLALVGAEAPATMEGRTAFEPQRSLEAKPVSQE